MSQLSLSFSAAMIGLVFAEMVWCGGNHSFYLVCGVYA